MSERGVQLTGFTGTGGVVTARLRLADGGEETCPTRWPAGCDGAQHCAPSPRPRLYSQERGAVGEQVIRNAGRLTAFGTLRGRGPQMLRNGAIRTLAPSALVRRLISRTISEVAIHYPHSALNGPKVARLGGPAPGERMPASMTPAADGGPRFDLFADAAAAVGILAVHGDIFVPGANPPPRTGGI